jgi:hypothetical protein
LRPDTDGHADKEKRESDTPHPRRIRYFAMLPEENQSEREMCKHTAVPEDPFAGKHAFSLDQGGNHTKRKSIDRFHFRISRNYVERARAKSATRRAS